MTLRQKIFAALMVAAIFLIGIAGGSIWSNYKIGQLERAVESAKTDAAEKATAANEVEKRSAIFAAKTEYLEKKLAEIQAIARRQDEELEKLNVDTDAARGRVERARRARTAAATADELCERLAEVGHGCE